MLKHYTEKADSICIILCMGKENLCGPETQALLKYSREMALDVVKCDLDKFYTDTEGLSLEEKKDKMKELLVFGRNTYRQIFCDDTGYLYLN
jgi:hypothetical protein